AAGRGARPAPGRGHPRLLQGLGRGADRYGGAHRTRGRSRLAAGGRGGASGGPGRSPADRAGDPGPRTEAEGRNPFVSDPAVWKPLLTCELAARAWAAVRDIARELPGATFPLPEMLPEGLSEELLEQA